jgi:hypothetical protein
MLELEALKAGIDKDAAALADKGMSMMNLLLLLLSIVFVLEPQYCSYLFK